MLPQLLLGVVGVRIQSRAVNLIQWAARLGLLIMILSSFLPPPPRAILGETHTVETMRPQVCVHTRLIDEVDEWKIAQSLQYVREMGAATIVEFFPWAYVESSRDQYNWASVDRIVRHTENQGLRVIARLGIVPEWARPIDQEHTSTQNTLTPEFYADFAEFAAEFASRYAGIIDEFIIWNEPNLAFEWGFQAVDPLRYVELLQTVYPAVKRANPNAVVMAAPLAPTLEPRGSPNGLNDLLYLEALYENGAADYFDALAIHTYGFTRPADDPPSAETLNFRRAELLRAIMIRYGDTDTPAYITETGWNDSPRWANAVSPPQRIAETIRGYEIAESWDWLESMCVWVFRFPAPTFNYPDYFTLVNVDFQRKPIYYALRSYARGLAQSETLWLPPPVE